MIDVNLIWNNVRDLSRKDHAGYISTDEFNRSINLAQADLVEFYLAMYEKTGRFASALDPFRRQAPLSSSSPGIYPLPDDYRQWCEVGVQWVDTSCGDAQVELYPAEPLRANEKLLTLTSAIRRPSMFKRIFKYHILNGNLHLYPTSFMGNVHLEYLINPPDAARGYVLNTTTLEEDYDAPTTINLIWPKSEISNFTDLMLFYKGVVVQSTPLLQWVAAKKQATAIPEAISLSQNS